MATKVHSGSPKTTQLVPAPVHDIQVNFCKNPPCGNFGVPASTERHPYGRAAVGHYGAGVSGINNRPIIRCSLCHQTPIVKSNQGIFEELTRISSYLNKPYCRNMSCTNYGVQVKTGQKLYKSFGRTSSGAQRYQCLLCGATFSVKQPDAKPRSQNHAKPHKNATIFRELMNKTPFKRLCEIVDMSPRTLYHKIDFIHHQCLAFVSDREERLSQKQIDRLYIGVDRQEYTINWPSREDRRNSFVLAIGSADNGTGYVFGAHLNYDRFLDPVIVEKEASAFGDYQPFSPFRRHARLWLQDDYGDALRSSRTITRPLDLDEQRLPSIDDRYQQMQARQDIEAPDELTDEFNLPSKGVQVHAEYTIYAHFYFLRKLLQGVEKVRFFLDQDSGMRAGCLTAFADRIKGHRCDAFYVRIDTKLRIDERRQVVIDAMKLFKKARNLHPHLTDWEVRLLLLKDSISKVRAHGRWQDKWVHHPFPSMSEPAKAMCYLTDIHNYDEEHLAWLYNKASLHAIDRFFMMARRRVQLLERPFVGPSSVGRRFYIYSPYNPAMVEKLLDIFRVWHNYIFATGNGKEKQTPAMKLGLSKGPVTYEDIIYFS